MKKNAKTTKKNQSSNFKLSALNPCVAGIDIGARSIFVCVGFKDGHQEVREFLTFTQDLRDMADWLKQCGISSVAMESTGVYWIPVYDILAERGFKTLLVNSHHLKTVPGRKTDVKDCQWIQQLHAYGLLRGSFRPDDECVTLRGYVRQRSRLFELAAQQTQLMHKSLVQMNLQLNHAISDITGVTGMKIIRAIAAGERDPQTLANYRDYRCKTDKSVIAKALDGNYRQEHLLALKQALEGYDFFHKHAMECEEEIERILSKWEITSKKKQASSDGGKSAVEINKTPKNGKGLQKKTASNLSPYHFEARVPLKNVLKVDLMEIPGLDVNGVMKILAEIGTDMSKWPSSRHFASWLGLCPGNKISGGKTLNSATKPTANRAAHALRLAANTLYRSKTALGAYFRKMRARLGAPKAITAAAHKLAKILYVMLKSKTGFHEIGQDAYEKTYKKRQLAALKRKAKEMGYNLTAA